MEAKYDWTPMNVESQFKSANSFLSKNLVKQTQKKMEENIAYIKNTGLNQTLYIKNISAKTSGFNGSGEFTVVGDRVLGIKTARFTSPLKVVLTVEKEKRSRERPHGLFITGIDEIVPSGS